VEEVLDLNNVMILSLLAYTIHGLIHGSAGLMQRGGTRLHKTDRNWMIFEKIGLVEMTCSDSP
jgi:hypothetical protein